MLRQCVKLEDSIWREDHEEPDQSPCSVRLTGSSTLWRSMLLEEVCGLTLRPLSADFLKIRSRSRICEERAVEVDEAPRTREGVEMW